MQRLLILMLLTMLITISCKSTNKNYKKFEPQEIESIENKGKLTKKWSYKLDSSKVAYGYKLVPFIDGNDLYVASQKGEVSKLNAQTGSSVWSVDLKTELSAGPGVGEKYLVVGTPEGEVIALNEANGSKVWSATLSSEVLSPPVVHNGSAIIRTQDGRVFSLNVKDGSRNWLFDTNIPNLTLRGNSKPVVKAGRIFIGFDNGKVAAIQQDTGDVIWLQNVVDTKGKTELARIVDIDGDMALIATDLYLSSAIGKTIAVATESGRVMWSIDSGSAAGVTASRNSLFMIDNESNVHALNRTDGTEKWKTESFKYRQLTKPSFYLGDIIVGDYEGYIHILDGANGNILARTRIGKDNFFSEPIVLGNLIVSYNKDGTLEAYEYTR
jgi:outer membrane protein assembly factor BamB